MDIILKTSKKHQSDVLDEITRKKSAYSDIKKIERNKQKSNYYVLIHHNKLRQVDE